jgi:hypothetical protein
VILQSLFTVLKSGGGCIYYSVSVFTTCVVRTTVARLKAQTISTKITCIHHKCRNGSRRLSDVRAGLDQELALIVRLCVLASSNVERKRMGLLLHRNDHLYVTCTVVWSLSHSATGTCMSMGTSTKSTS